MMTIQLIAQLLSGGSKPSATTVTGLSHLEGKTVKVIADDGMQNDKTVSSGQITLDAVPQLMLR